MVRIAHIVNLFKASETSDLHLAQEVTVASMIAAQEYASSQINVSLFSAQFKEDRNLVPREFEATMDLKNSILDQRMFSKKIKLPMLADILQRLYESTDAEYLIYSNVDIGVQPDFYLKVNEFIELGHDAFMVNRRRIPAKFNSIEQLEEMYAEKGLSHPGFDCFIFHRDLFPKFSLADVCIGIPFIEITFSQNLFCFAKNPKVFTDEHVTFHIGLEIFKKRAPKEFLSYNKQQFWKAMRQIWNELDSRKWPHGKEFFLFRMIRWGLHPCYPIRLALKLEPRRYSQSNTEWK